MTTEIRAGYEMTAASNSTVGYWERCKATTLLGAKREAMLRYRAGYMSDMLQVGVRDESGQLQVLASRLNRYGKWAEAMTSAAARELGRLGGLARSEAKARAARSNGKLGGRPKQRKAKRPNHRP